MRIKLFKLFRAITTLLYLVLLIGAFNLMLHNPMTKDENIAFVMTIIAAVVVVSIREYLDTAIIQDEEKDKVSSTDNS